MHMADALISPAVGGTMLAVTVSVMALSISKTVKSENSEKKIPLMAVMGAFIFAAQMINFSIPGTGSSGHITGALLLAALLGPYAGFLTMGSILLIQALFFGDGGLLAYGANVFNMGFYTCFLTYPLIYKSLLKKKTSTTRIFIAAILASLIGMQFGAFSVVLETLLSGKTELPFKQFFGLMQSIHLAIGLVEGLISACIINYVWKTRPEILDNYADQKSLQNVSLKKIIITFSIAFVLIGGIASWFASSNPDGLEWSIFQTTGSPELENENKLHQQLADIQEKTSFLPDYDFKNAEENTENSSPANPGTTLSGLVGSLITIGIILLFSFIFVFFKKKKKKEE